MKKILFVSIRVQFLLSRQEDWRMLSAHCRSALTKKYFDVRVIFPNICA